MPTKKKTKSKIRDVKVTGKKAVKVKGGIKSGQGSPNFAGGN